MPSEAGIRWDYWGQMWEAQGEGGGHTNELPPRTLSSCAVHSLDFQGLVSGYCQQIPSLVRSGVLYLLPPKSIRAV